MTLALSCSSPVVSLALIGDGSALLFADQRESNQNAAETCLRLLEKGLVASGRSKTDIVLIVSDVGPGSFIGVRVGVTIAKTLAYALQISVAAVPSFDFMDPDGTVVIPSKKGEYFVRHVGNAAYRTSELPKEAFTGYGPDILEQRYPDARLAASQLSGLKTMRAEELVPQYLIEPSISVPKRPFSHLSQ